MSQLTSNTLTSTDVYKLGHMEFYPEGTTKVYSYLIARSSKKFDATVFFGLQAFIKEYLTRPITDANVDELLEMRAAILGSNLQELSVSFAPSLSLATGRS